jgi:hypothetical protein
MKHKTEFKKHLEARARQKRNELISDIMILTFFLGCFIVAGRIDYLMFFAN